MKNECFPINRRVFMAAVTPVLAPLAALAQPQGFPTKPIRIVVPFGAGGVADLTARTVGQKLAQSLGQAVVIDNKPGAGGIAATDAVVKADPDGHTLLLMSNATAVSAGLFKSLPFDALRDLTPVSTLGFFDIALLVKSDSPFKTLAELLQHAKTHPGTVNLGSINIGSTQHLAAELFKTLSGVDLQIVPFNGTPAVVNALRGGQIDAAVEILSPVMPQVQAKALRALSVFSSARSSALPEVPTAQEAGIKGMLASSWNGLAAPAKTPKAVIERLQRDVHEALTSPEVTSRLKELHVEARASTSSGAREHLVQETKRWGEVIARAKIPAQ